MKTKIEIDTEKPETLNRILSPSLQSRGKVNVETKTRENMFNIEIETQGIGPLRGTTDNVFRLTSLAKKITQK